MNSFLLSRIGLDRPLILGHRGSVLKGKYPENSLPAFQEALQLGADGVELDVRLSHDGEIVICHDHNLLRLCGVNNNLEDLSWKELRRLELLGKNGRGNHLPLLAEIFDSLGSVPVYNIEIKKKWTSYRLLMKKLDSLIREFRLQDRVWVSSFDPLFLVVWRRLHNAVSTAFLTESWNPFIFWLSGRSFVDLVHPDIRLLPDMLRRPLTSKEMCFWTVNSRSDLEEVKKRENIFAIITDDIPLALEVFPNH